MVWTFFYCIFFRIPKCQDSRVKRIETQSSNKFSATDDLIQQLDVMFPDPGKISTTTTSTTTTTQHLYMRPTEPRYVRPVEVQTRGARPVATYRPRTDYVDPPKVQYETTTAMERGSSNPRLRDSMAKNFGFTASNLSVQRMVNLNTVPSTTTHSSTENSAVEVLEDNEPNENEVSSQENESDKQPQNSQGQLSVQVPKSVQSLTCK